MLKPLRYKVGGPSEVYASRAAFFLCGINRRDMGVLLMRLQGQGGWRIGNLLITFRFSAIFLVISRKRYIFAEKFHVLNYRLWQH